MQKTVEITDTAIYSGVNAIAEQLPSSTSIAPGDTIILKFSGGNFVFLTGLVLLAAWRKSLVAGVNVSVDDSLCNPNTQRFLTNTGFREIVETGHETPSIQRRVGRVPLQPITNKFTKEATVNDILPIFEEYAGHVEDMNPFKVLISELCENVLAHSELSAPGYVCARVLEGPYKAEIAICDTGVGFRNSYLSGTNSAAIERIKNGASPIQIAIDGLNTSKPIQTSSSLRSYYGFGLFLTRRLIEENRGQMYIVSGKEGLHIDRYHRQHLDLPNEFRGTFIALVIDLGNPLPLEEIYEEATDSYVSPPDSAPPVPERKSSIVTPESVDLEAPSKSPSKTREETKTEEIPEKVISNSEESRTKKVELRHYGSELLTRDAGTAIRADIGGYLAAGYIVEAQLDGVTDLTPSVADEAFGKLAELLGFEEFEQRVKIIGGTQLAQRLVTFVLKTRRSRNDR